MSTTTAPPTAHAAARYWNPLPFAREVASTSKVYRIFFVLALTIGVLVRLATNHDGDTMTNILFAVVTLPAGSAVLVAHAVLAVERAVLTERGIES